MLLSFSCHIYVDSVGMLVKVVIRVFSLNLFFCSANVVHYSVACVDLILDLFLGSFLIVGMWFCLYSYIRVFVYVIAGFCFLLWFSIICDKFLLQLQVTFMLFLLNIFARELVSEKCFSI